MYCTYMYRIFKKPKNTYPTQQHMVFKADLILGHKKKSLKKSKTKITPRILITH